MRAKRLVLLSNRLPNILQASSPEEIKNMPVGGLVSALVQALERIGGGVWGGWSGKSVKASITTRYRKHKIGNIELIPIDLTESEVSSYYNGFCNRTIWPLCHLFQGRVKITANEEQVYRRVNGGFATIMRKFLEKKDIVWIHDYHLIRAGRDLRDLDWTGPMGFFLHIPFPPLEIWSILPNAKGYLSDLMAYDLVGFHTEIYRDNYVYTQQRRNGASWDGKILTVGGESQRVEVFPIGTDPDKFRPTSPRKKIKVDGAGDIVIGVDRLDYTKGVPERIRAFETLFHLYPKLKGKVSLMQICSPSRTRVPEYLEQKRAVDALVGRINGELGSHDWTPIRYLYRSYRQEELAIFYRDARVGLVTPLRDGMNLVAKEFVASQDPDDPGVLVLSRFTGAAEELTDAILVNPYEIEDVAHGIARALSMPLAERKKRYESLYEKVCRHTAQSWANDFLSSLEEAHSALKRK